MRPLPYSLQRVSLPATQLTMAPARSAAWGGAPWARRPPEPIRLAELARLSPCQPCPVRRILHSDAGAQQDSTREAGVGRLPVPNGVAARATVGSPRSPPKQIPITNLPDEIKSGLAKAYR